MRFVATRVLTRAILVIGLGGSPAALAQAPGTSEPPAAGADEHAYGRPWFLVKAGVGIPNLLNAHVEVFVHRHWTVEVGAGVGLLPLGIEGSVRWRPERSCWGCDGHRSLSIGYGLDSIFMGTEGPSGGVAVVVTASVDATYVYRFAEHFGVMAGARAGIGPTTEFGTGRAWWKFEPALNIILLQLGLAF